MGQFSWICSDTNRQLLNDTHADTYLLVPKPFQEKYGKTIYEGYYDGYGRFGGYDVYNLIPEWNKEMIPEIIRRIKNGTWFCNATESDVKDLLNYYSGEEIGCLADLGFIFRELFLCFFQALKFSEPLRLHVVHRASLFYFFSFLPCELRATFL